VGHVVVVAQLTVDVHRLPVTRDRPLDVAEVSVRVAEAVPCGGLGGTVAEFLCTGERVLTVHEGLTMVAHQRVVPAERVEGRGDAGSMPGTTEQAKRALLDAAFTDSLGPGAAHPGQWCSAP